MTRKRKTKRRLVKPSMKTWGRWLAGAVVLGLVMGGATRASFWLLDPETLPIRSVQVEGGLRYLDAERLRQVVAPHASGGFFTVDIEAVQAAVADRPWVDRATVRRVWPDSLRISVTEHRPLARWGDDGLLSHRGRWFAAPQSEFTQQLPTVHGPDGFEETLARRYRELDRMFASIGRRIVELQVSDRRAWRLRLDNGLDVRVGRRDLKRRLSRFLRIYSDVEAMGNGEMATVDLRYTNGLAVQWHAPQPDAGGA